MRYFYHLLIVFIACSATGCGKRDSFKLSGTISDIGNSRVELLYCNNGAYTRLGTAADNGSFVINGSSSSPAVAFLSVSGGSPLAELIVVNGADIHCEINPQKPFELKIKGNKDNEEYAKFLNANAVALASDSPDKINNAVKSFIEKNKKSMSATMALITLFRSADNEIAADSLMGIIAPEARPLSLLANYNDVLAGQLATEAKEPISSMTVINSRDSVIRFNPYRYKRTLLAFTGDTKICRDSILPKLRSLSKDYPQKRLSIMEVNTSPDSASWKHVIEKDSASWQQVWQPGSVSAPSFRRMAVARIPFFIIVDSIGNQLYRGSSVSAAERYIRQHLAIK